jgi:uncharacterized protein
MKLIVVFAVFVPSVAFAQAPSFDCALATRADEIAICSDPQLAELEKTLADAYQALKDQQGPNAAKSIGTPILMHRRQCGSDAEYIYDVFESGVAKYQEAGVLDVALATEMNTLTSEWHDANGNCRDAQGADDVNQQCGLRDQLGQQLNYIGLCQGNYLFDSPYFQMATI